MLSKIKVTDGEGDIRGDGNNDAMNSTGKLEHRRGAKRRNARISKNNCKWGSILEYSGPRATVMINRTRQHPEDDPSPWYEK